MYDLCVDFETNNADPIVSRLVTSSDTAALTTVTFPADGSGVRSGAEGSLDQWLGCQVLGRPEGTQVTIQIYGAAVVLLD